MDREVKIIIVKFMIIVALVLAYVFIMFLVVGILIPPGPTIPVVHAQSAFDTPNQFNPDPYNQYNQQYQQQPYGMQQPYGYDQYNQQYQQPYGGYQQPYGIQQPYGYPQVQQNPLQFGTSEIIYTLLGGGAIGYARYNQHKRNQDKEVQRDIVAELLKEKQEKRELARVSYQQMPQQGNNITDAPSIQLQKLDADIEQFSDKVAKV